MTGRSMRPWDSSLAFMLPLYSFEAFPMGIPLFCCRSNRHFAHTVTLKTPVKVAWAVRYVTWHLLKFATTKCSYARCGTNNLNKTTLSRPNLHPTVFICAIQDALPDDFHYDPSMCVSSDKQHHGPASHRVQIQRERPNTSWDLAIAKRSIATVPY